ncbi:MAG: geranylgeranylglycerol-phosphate geranylgeranyltransferase [Flavobacteriales bacterium]|jgi:4-hydroxybenzoate polyprenyltransferase
MKLRLSEFDFFLSVLVVVLLTAAGNIINDYFDVKVDLINKPDRVVVGKTVKRRVAMVLHQSFNIIGVFISIYLSIKYNLWWPVLIPVVIATLLWFYSPIFKKQIFSGNLVVALCVSFVPIWTGAYEIPLIIKYYKDIHQNADLLQTNLWIIIGAYALFAFLLSLSREALKDLEDLKGDKIGQYQTMPIVKGEGFTRNYAALMMLLCLGAVSLAFYRVGLHPGTDINAALALAACVIIPGMLTIFISLFARKKSHYSIASLLAKITMAGGLVLCVLAGNYLWSC